MSTLGKLFDVAITTTLGESSLNEIKGFFEEKDGNITLKEGAEDALKNALTAKATADSEKAKKERDNQYNRGYKKRSESVNSVISELLGVQVNDKELTEDYLKRAYASVFDSKVTEKAKEDFEKFKKAFEESQSDNFNWQTAFSREDAQTAIKQTALYKQLEQAYTNQEATFRQKYEQQLNEAKREFQQKAILMDFARDFEAYHRDNPSVQGISSKTYKNALRAFESQILPSGVSISRDEQGGYSFEKDGKRFENGHGVAITQKDIFKSFYDNWFDEKSKEQGNITQTPNGGNGQTNLKYKTKEDLDKALKEGKVKDWQYANFLSQIE